MDAASLNGLYDRCTSRESAPDPFNRTYSQLTLVKRHQLVPLQPFALDLADLRCTRATCFRLLDCLCERTALAAAVRSDTEDVLVVTHVDGARDEASGLRVCTCNKQHRMLQEVELEARRDEPRDVRRGRHKYFAREVPALLAADELVFEVNRGGALGAGERSGKVCARSGGTYRFGKELCELHDGRLTPVPIASAYNQSPASSRKTFVICTPCLRPQ